MPFHWFALPLASIAQQRVVDGQEIDVSKAVSFVALSAHDVPFHSSPMVLFTMAMHMVVVGHEIALAAM